MNESVAAVILAAGKGTRMKSELPKGLHKVCGLPIIELVARAMSGAGANRIVLVVGHGADAMKAAFGDRYQYALQQEQHGTGHACQCAMPALDGFDGIVIVGTGDSPLVTAEAMKALVARKTETGASMVIGTCLLDDPGGYGRVVREGDRAAAIVEHNDASPDQRLIKEINAAFYCFDASVIREMLPKLSNNNAKGEYYLTDLAEMISASGGCVETLIFDDADLMRGVNDRWQLTEAAAVLRKNVLRRHAINGITIVDPATTYIDVDVEIAEDTVIEPMTVLEGFTRIGSKCIIGPMTRITDCEVGDACTVFMSHLSRASVGAGTRIGPYANVRPHTKIGEGVKIGNFVELKNAEVGDKSSLSHLTYDGDATVGVGAKIGAGTITCNYDGFAKHRTDIGNGAFVGSNSTLVAPVTIGEGAFIAAGSVITEDVPADALAVGRTRQVTKEGWASRWRSRKG
ncbi:MAG: bifunctional UDP-N-acetylglucosamine diphosphorylase/glucosamine-1-phosphate N-acetyltransferase GlmU [Fimbriimonadales bacterium]